ncbi:OmpA family protein [Kribbella sp. NPDC051718]|uniref:OmpA family protein n=1 Tax=Kribbella sp. NPDC051718 TaxID=3155168 RepID=UPI00341B8625
MSTRPTGRRRLLTAAVVLAVISPLVACGKHEPAKAEQLPMTSDVAVVVSVHRNAPKMSGQQVLKVLPELTNGDRLTAVGVDGTVDGLPIVDGKIIGTAKSGPDRLDAISDAKSEFVTKIDGAAAEAAESDPLAAIAVAARQLKGSPATKKLLIIADPLLPTAGDLQFQRLGFDWTTEDIWERLNSHKPTNLPDLRDIHVVVLGLGATTSPQQALDEGRKKQLEDLWRTILIRSGDKRTTVDFASAVLAAVPSTSQFEVSVVPVKRPEPPPPGRKPQPCKEQVIPETVVQFKPDTAEFLAPPQARAAAERVAEAFENCPGRLTVTGTTSSWGTEAGRKRVSTDRAESFRSLLAEVLNVSPASIVAVGVGKHFGAFVNDRSRTGELIPELAIRNRTVRVTVAPLPPTH